MRDDDPSSNDDPSARSDVQWRERLTDEQYHVTREGGTEPAFTGVYWDCKREGTYRCLCCDAPLFHSQHKYESGSGWPSFHSPLAAQNLKEEVDTSHGMMRIELRCARCDAHLGHRFPDGPLPTGQRYCINSLSLSLDETALSEGDGEKK